MQLFNLPADRSGITALLFDIDNTLYKNDEYVKSQTALLTKRFALETEFPICEAKDLINREKKRYADKNDGNITSWGNLMAGLGVEIQKNAVWREQMFQPEVYLQQDNQLASVLELLSEHYAMVAVTNNPREIGRRTLATLGVDSYLKNIVGLDTCHISKPGREPFLEALAILQKTPKETASIGDRYSVDIQVPVSLGMSGILVETLSDVYQLPSVLLS